PKFAVTTYYFLPNSWRDLVFKGIALRSVNKELVGRGILIPGKDGKAAQVVALPGLGNTRTYVVSNKVLFAEEAA
ncbi:UNVERIFIED_CONTAM: hypothetical protein QOZ76_29145, partial [Pseudomonas aeruginosa]